MADPRERPILFSAPTVRALLDSRKTQTRRIIDRQPFQRREEDEHEWWRAVGGKRVAWESNKRLMRQFDKGGKLIHEEVRYQSPSEWLMPKCPYGQPGDRLWVKEAWKTAKINDHLGPASMIKACRDAGWKSGKAWAPLEYLADGTRVNWDAFPQDLGRYRNAQFMPRDYSRITLEITDVRVQRLQDISERDAAAEGIEGPYSFDPMLCPGPRASLVYSRLWDSIHGDGAWEANPWVWALTFRVLRPAVAAESMVA